MLLKLRMHLCVYMWVCKIEANPNQFAYLVCFLFYSIFCMISALLLPYPYP